MIADRVRRADAIKVPCPQCKALPEQPCIGARCNYRISCHAGRHAAAIAAGYPILPLGVQDDTMTAGTAPIVGTPAVKTEGRRQRRGRRRPSFWNKLEFTCHSCWRHFAPATIRIVQYEGRYWCDQCYRAAAGIPRVDQD